MQTNIKVSLGCLIALAVVILLIAVGCTAASLQSEPGEIDIDIDHKRPKSTTSAPRTTAPKATRTTAPAKKSTKTATKH